jgi:protein phosphatase
VADRSTGRIEALRYRVVASVTTDVGCRRETNEDCARIIQPADEELLSQKGMLVVVADGMGGALGGEVASRIAVDVVGRVYYNSDAEPGQALQQAFQDVNREILAMAESRPELFAMGSTCTALALRGGAAYMAHVGDSRLYLIRSGTIYRMTEDHSAVMEMVKQGLLSIEQARRHADRNVILRALGTRPEVDVSTWPVPLGLRDGDRFVLCSDGLHDLLSDDEIRDCVLARPPEEAAEMLVAIAKDRGGYDNITAGVVAIEAELPLES